MQSMENCVSVAILEFPISERNALWILHILRIQLFQRNYTIDVVIMELNVNISPINRKIRENRTMNVKTNS
ncbi:hypothetical protein PV327_009864 [Microctonus hyperodae]|uniref:Uncharacterized protein n=1 Tax=Microctonus hyperodae TaxID=165561 RepID=A0AA39F1V1_MICHY|nr:hypothetical protein PV327_009864 [Microctonus hyperodae]